MNVKSSSPSAHDGGGARDDAPRLTGEIAARAQLAIGDRVIRRGRPPKAPGERKEAVSLRLSPFVVAYFREGGDGWQTRIDEALQAVVRSRAPGGAIANSGRATETLHEDRSSFEHEGNAAGRKPPS